MSRKKDKGRIGGPFVPLLKETLNCAAWKAMEPSSRLLYIALKGRYGIDAKNNGKLYMSVRIAMEEIGLAFNTICRGFQELQHYGFAVMTEGGCLGVDGKGKSPHWRLTELGYMHDQPTKDYLRWDGVLFGKSKNRIPTQPLSHPDSLTESPPTQPLSQSGAEVTQPLRHTGLPVMNGAWNCLRATRHWHRVTKPTTRSGWMLGSRRSPTNTTIILQRRSRP
jgi:hypothetical protein